MLHSKDESYTELRAAAIRFEAQQRLFTELGASMTGSGRGHGVFQVQGDGAEEEGEDPEDLYVEAVGKGGCLGFPSRLFVVRAGVGGWGQRVEGSFP